MCAKNLEINGRTKYDVANKQDELEFYSITLMGIIKATTYESKHKKNLTNKQHQGSFYGDIVFITEYSIAIDDKKKMI